MNLIDVLLVLTLLLSAVRGFRHGALSQLAAFGGAVVGLLAGAILAPRAAGAIAGTPGVNLALLTIAFLLFAIFACQGIGLAIGMRLRAAAHGAGAAPVDRTFGVVIGVVGLLLTVWLLAAALVQGPWPPVAQQLRESRIVTALDDALPTAPNIFSRLAAYLDRHGFPQVFSGLGDGPVAGPVDPPPEAAVAAAQAAGAPSTVQVQALGCNGVSSGSGFVVAPGFIVSNAHVIAGGEALSVRDRTGLHEAVAIHFDPVLDLAVLSAPSITAPPIGWVATPADRGVAGASLGFPGGRAELVVEPAVVRSRGEALGRDIYGRGVASREILTLDATVQRGDSGGPFVTSEGLVGGVVFAAAPDQPRTGYALTAERVRPDVDAAIGRNAPATTGECRF